MSKIELLDCTLRDGGHINKSRFGKDVIIEVIQNLLESRVDIIEVGFLQNCEYDPDVAMYNSIAEATQFLPQKRNGVKYALMAQEDLYDIDKLEDCDGSIEIIRISFHDYDIEEGLSCAQKVVDKGYKCFINPINLVGYSDENIINLIKRVNEIGPYGFTIVDTFGSMMSEDLQRLYYLIHHNLDEKIELAVHLHENLSLSYSLAQTFLSIKSPSRDVCVDGSLYGMGRVPGNLCIELIMDYMNRTYGTTYDIEPVYDAIDHYVIDWKKTIPWGYSTAYALSAQHRVHRTYAEYLLEKGRLRTKQINQILSMIEDNKRTKFDSNYIEQLYIKFQNNMIDDSDDIEKLSDYFADRNILIIAPGASIKKYEYEIKQLVDTAEPITISVNFIWDKLRTDFTFFSNFRRLSEFGRNKDKEKFIATSNLLLSGETFDYVINYSDFAYFGNRVFDNSVIMLLNLLAKITPKKIYIAGFDGFSEKNNFATEKMNVKSGYQYSYDNNVIKRIISTMKKTMPLHFITPTIYSEEE